ncbi:anhydro-N-acetylmuramic acid kinase [Noviherbaspirillum aridicola]|uniref:Anhydro-N-acetylmuramic acid kinase n=1 Tax=Noviherbaspirillum aridicola TaxID=2849687 RepID=A0ABQ4Q7C0_9BURK|nr:anhydro-N-acetylmuramic acid kinase [Noviherbaspirillum aridicola]GIZ52896.1 anhydro-N-acetylmuramic acid kinase [Noviherbaspirillum aridicola]
MQLFIGLMSGTSMDGVDGVLAALPDDGSARGMQTLASAWLPFPDDLRADLMSLQSAAPDEIQREALAANALSRLYADCVARLLDESGKQATDIRAIGAHGQTIRHRPELGFTRQIGNAALLAELSGIDVVADFRSRDVAAGGQGAPLVPAFHQAVFGADNEVRVVANIGGIANISVLQPGTGTTGFDTGPGNVLMDYWIGAVQGKSYDAGGGWAASGRPDPALLETLLDEPYFRLPPPKSTGRDLFHRQWLEGRMTRHAGLAPEDVQATLARLTAASLADAIANHAPTVRSVFVCGGGAHNGHLMNEIRDCLRARALPATVDSTDRLGVAPGHVEALAFAWLAQRHVLRQPGNIAEVTGAAGPRILGALYPR